MAKEFTLDQLGRDGGAVHRHEGAGRTGTLCVQFARHELLAGARFALQQHRAVHRRHAGNGFAQLLHRGGTTHQRRAAHGQGCHGALEHEVLAAQARALVAVLHGIEDLWHAKGLEDEVRCTGAQGLDGGVQIGERGDQDHLAGEALLAQFLEPAHPVLAGQGNVEDHQIGVVTAQPLGAFFGAARAHHELATRGEGLDQEVEHALFVVDDQDRPVGPAFEVLFGEGGE
ncbi:hypothetical protein D9M68_784450 [compost metagenome]